MVTSAETGAGKSTIAANLATALAQAGCSVVLVDCDLRMPTLHRMFDVPNELGLSTVLEERSTLEEALQSPESAKIMLLTSGPRPDKPAELLASPQMGELLNHLEQQFDKVVIDVPALLEVADASILAKMMDQVLLVVQSGYTREEEAQAAYQQLILVQAHLTGVVMNRVPSDPTRYKKYYRMLT
jgi:capsular exopolysaccharide synthesis family protein